MRRLLAIRKGWRALGEGHVEFLAPQNRKVLAYVLRYEQETLLVVANLSRFPQPVELDTGAENQLCPTGAIQRTFVEDPYYEYKIDEKMCIGCAKCVEGCNRFGNGSLFLQIRHDRCVNCNECAIAAACPSGAYVRVPADTPYLLKDKLSKT